jgi:hypothetical protein
MTDEYIPILVIFFPNDTASVCGKAGQIPKYQRGNHQETIKLLREDGYDWRKLEVLGEPKP